MRRWLTAVAVVVVGLVVAGAAAVGWYYSGEILVVGPTEDPVFDTEVLAVEAGLVTLADSEEALRDGVWGLRFDGGYATLGAILAAEPGQVTREIVPLEGMPEAGDAADVDGYAFPEDAARAGFDFDVTRIGVEGPLGEYPAWFADPGAPSDTWAVLVHGRAARLNECFRLLETMVDRGIPSLCPSYRNDADAPADPGGLYRQGAQEWRDIEAAVAEAVARGASDIVLVGYSMGGQISANFLRRSPLAERVRAVVWDAPLLDWGPVLELAASDRGVPTAVVPLGMFASQLRAGIDYDDLDQVANADEFDTPILLIHGTDDDTVPLSVADRFAQARPDLVTYLRVEGAGHVHAWNVDPPVYEQAVDDFLDEVLGAG